MSMPTCEWTPFPERISFPNGEIGVKAKGKFDSPYMSHREFEWNDNDSLIEFLFWCDLVKRSLRFMPSIIIPYVPYSRQDREIEGQAFSLKIIADIINTIGAPEVLITDPHSDVTPALIKNCRVIHQWQVFAPVLKNKKDYYLISPDGGALKKIYELAKRVDSLGVIECSKHRDVKTGKILATHVHADALNGKDCVIVDDICDGGKTFIEIAKVLKEKGAGRISLYVTHGFFTKGLQVFNGLIDEIVTRKGKIK